MMQTQCQYCQCFTCLTPFCEIRTPCGKCVSTGYEKIKRKCGRAI